MIDWIINYGYDLFRLKVAEYTNLVDQNIYFISQLDDTLTWRKSSLDDTWTATLYQSDDLTEFLYISVNIFGRIYTSSSEEENCTTIYYPSNKEVTKIVTKYKNLKVFR